MTSYRLPVNASLRFPKHVYDLDGSRFRVEYKYHQREDRWYFDLYDATGALIRVGIKLVLGVPLLRLEASRDKPAGNLIAIDTTGANDEAGLLDLDERVQLVYVEAT